MAFLRDQSSPSWIGAAAELSCGFESRSNATACWSRPAVRHWRAAMIGLALLCGLGVRGEESSRSLEYKVKAAYLFNFAKYIEWPAAAFAGADSPIVIGILGEDPFGEVLEKTLENRKINNRAVRARRGRMSEELKDCHVIFVSGSEKLRLSGILTNWEPPFALTVSDSERFVQLGGMLQFVFDEGTVRFEIDLDRAEKAGLKIGSRMLSSAKSVFSQRAQRPK